MSRVALRLPRSGRAGGGPAVEQLLRSVRYEVIPTASIEDKVLASVPVDVPVTVTASPSKGLSATLDLAESLAGHGYSVVPHISARLVRDRVELAEIVERMRGAGVEDVFVPAGDADPHVGAYDAALPLLTDLSLLGRPFPHVGITGYPETHPSIDDDVTVQAMWDKREHATYVVSNLCFDPRLLTAWVSRLRRRGVTLPVRIGMAGPVETTKLLSMAGKIGVGESARFLTGHASWFMRLAAPGGYSPEKFLAQVAPALTAPVAAVTGLHVFTFNQVAETERWRQQLLSSYT